MESVNGWIKAEMFMDLHVTGEKSVAEEVDDYIHFFNEQRPAYTLGYLTPKQYRSAMFLNAKLIRVMVGIKCPAVFETMSKESMCLVQGLCFYV